MFIPSKVWLMYINNSIWCVPLHVQCSKTNKGLTNIWHCWKDQTLGFPSKFAVWSSCCLYLWLKETHSCLQLSWEMQTAPREKMHKGFYRSSCLARLWAGSLTAAVGHSSNTQQLPIPTGWAPTWQPDSRQTDSRGEAVANWLQRYKNPPCTETSHLQESFLILLTGSWERMNALHDDVAHVCLCNFVSTSSDYATHNTQNVKNQLLLNVPEALWR